MQDLPQNVETVSKIKSLVNKDAHGKLLNLSISGAHAYGFESPDSDFDWRGTFIVQTDLLLGMHHPTPRVSATWDDGKHDVLIEEIGHILGLAAKSNCTTLEKIFEPQIITTSDFLTMQRLVASMMSKKGLADSYKGMATFNYKKYIADAEKKTAKKYLYVLRALMAGIWALRTGTIQPNLNILNKSFELKVVDALIELKKAGGEKMQLKDIDELELQKQIDILFLEIDKATVGSALPDTPSKDVLGEVDDWLKDFRVANLERVRK